MCFLEQFWNRIAVCDAGVGVDLSDGISIVQERSCFRLGKLLAC